MKTLSIFLWIARVVAAVILLQTLFFKFSASPESVYIFTTVGMEPWGRIGTGIIELIAAVLLFVPRYSWTGALLALGTMSGAIFFHLTILGISVQNDGGQLFIYGLLVWVSCFFIAFIQREEIFRFLSFLPFFKKNLL
jgi:uncharacterized membrane protein YphA (DoxX/SURF4 family)